MQAALLIVFEILKKYWLYIVGAIGLLFLYRKMGFGKNYVNTEYDKKGVTITDSQSLVYAENLYNAMKDFGTDEDVLKQVYSVLVQNPSNVKAVYNAFGYRDYSLFGAPVGFWMPSDKISLKEWIKRETSGTMHDSWMSLFNASGII